MLKDIRPYLLSLLLALVCGDACAQNVPIFDTLSAVVYFRKNSSTLDLDYHGNGVSLFRFIEDVNSLQAVSYTNVYQVKCLAWTDLDDFLNADRLICNERNQSVRSVLDRYLSLRPEKLEMRSMGLNRKWLLTNIGDGGLSYGKDIESVIKNIPEKVFNGDTLSRSYIFELMNLDRGEVWNMLRDNCFEDMNMVELLCLTDRRIPVMSMSKPPEFADFYPAEEIFSGKHNSFAMTARTNLLADVALIPSLGLDFYLGHNFSIGAQWGYAYWTNSSRNYIYKCYGGDFEVRWWFSKRCPAHPLTGHHAGVYGQMQAFDFAFGTNRFSAPQWFWAAGAEYGYTIPLKGTHLAFDFSLGIGYAGGSLSTWFLETNAAGENYYEWNTTESIQYVGPTKAEISFIWLIGGWYGRK